MHTQPIFFQASFPQVECPIATATEALASGGGIEALGAIFTRSEVVNFILDLAGYTSDKPLHKQRLLEPSFGAGDFLLPAIERLLTAWRADEERESGIESLANAICAVELHRDTFSRTYSAVIDLLAQNGFSPDSAEKLADGWLTQDDFLLQPFEVGFDYVVGNPPYVRQELIPAPLLAEYRSRYKTLYDRADLYVPFIERSLSLLTKCGNLGFICADRWMKNKYGGPLRQMVADSFHLKIYVDMTDTPAFHTDVVAYPAVTIISRAKAAKTMVAHRPAIEKNSLTALTHKLLSKEKTAQSVDVREIAKVTNGADPWLLESSDQIALIRRLENEFPSLEDSGCKVGIGVATGADKAFIGPFNSLDVEPDRKLPLATTKDIVSGEVAWTGLGVINPFKDEGGLVDLDNYPRLKKYLEARRDVIASRHCAKKTPASWYKTIDRITPSLTGKQKLLIPDIKGEAHVVYEAGELYPHHNLYVVTSDSWNLRALQAVLMSAVSRLFVATYSTKMRGGFLRFQAQYLRRIRLPLWKTIPEELQRELIHAAESLDINACNVATFKIYGMTTEEIRAIGG